MRYYKINEIFILTMRTLIKWKGLGRSLDKRREDVTVGVVTAAVRESSFPLNRGETKQINSSLSLCEIRERMMKG
jgi:hypothetical protein